MVQTDRQTPLSPLDYHYNTGTLYIVLPDTLTSPRAVQGLLSSLMVRCCAGFPDYSPNFSACG